jgi:hypothetical protein
MKPEKLHELVAYCREFANTMLSDSGDFYPFGAAMGTDEQVRAVGAHNGAEHPDPRELYRLLATTLSAEAVDGRVAATAIASNVTIPSQYTCECRDGIRVQLETEGFARFIYFPYRLTKTGFFRKKIDVAVFEPFSVEIPATIFVSKSV